MPLLFAARAPRSRRDWPLWPALPVVLATLHLSYGSGALWDLVRWAGRWRGRYRVSNFDYSPGEIDAELQADVKAIRQARA